MCVVQRRTEASTPVAAHSLLLSKRPEQGLLAGLWEFPSTPVAVQASAEDRRQTVDTLLEDLGLGGVIGSAWRVVHRRDMGSVVHVFSHIRMTLHVEHLLVEGAADAVDEGQTWVTHAALCDGDFKLSGAPSKVFAMVSKGGAKGKGGTKENAGPRITAFFKAVGQ